ncbi:E3 ubiquitin-protein ligase AMFR [Parasteatoda tepidariorum]|nr:E3 ubiquitin-protein ligase AMFR [Parasteatoda tepidariorum]
MPSVLLDRLPLPSLQTYTTISILCFSCSIYYALKVTSDPGWTLNVTDASAIPFESEQDGEIEPLDSIRVLLHNLLINNLTKRLYDVVLVLIEEPLCVWSLINMVYCVMILIGKGIQKFVFGDLRVIEQQHMKDKFWNFVFYKFIFIFGVLNVQYMDEVILWCGWFSFVGAFHLLSQLCKDRFEYLSFSPTTPKWTHLRLFSLIFFILGVSVGLCTIVGLYASLNIFFFMAAEWTLVILRTLYVLVRYVIHLYDVTHEGIWERRGIYTYYSELVFELSSLVVDFLHHLHMLLWRNIFLSVASLVICMQLRCFFNEIQLKYIRHKNYLRVSRHMESNYPLATKEEIETNNDDCAICWDRMDTARKLPCGHMFHSSCLHSWLEQVTNCPTCRTPLVQKENSNNSRSDLNRNILGQEDQQRQANPTTNHFFHFDGSRYVSWFPSFSVEVSHTSLLGDRPQIIPIQTSQLDSMVHQVLQLFPHMPYNLVLEDLLTTRSVEFTVENILEERLTAPTTTMFPPTPPAHSPTSNRTSPFSMLLRRRSSINSQILHSLNLGQEMYSPSTSRSPTETDSAASSTAVADTTSQVAEEVSFSASGEGSRFSKNSSERQHMLSCRKNDLIQKARSKYMNRFPIEHPIYRRRHEESSSSSD